ncbi:TetR/AcrR family transcriptional regulator [Speluncibacter jeojiensis]|uniref:TetR/AcrR family transcriptional regulator n=1 Tax=Speluncibacter jeojiensis TaxID=2710754 RepID=A0A9X4M3G2_9ACTN|nr:TetR/AcrR family transcriptional regulator [Rhodococcus sp. D2-41]MDG3016330.1 TetR/AcrR family transcriptional regulator [Corynebacteriales bacterium D3-21]
MDGRKRRWQEHKLARREELVDGTLAAIRLRGSDIGMDEIAAEIGVSKTVLYRYFTDKSDLTGAATTRFMETRLAPALAEALSQDLDEYGLCKAAIGVYVRTVADEPEIYPFVMGMTSSSGTGVQDAVAKSERVIAEMLSTVLGEHLRARGMDSGGAEPWAYAVVGGVQLATHRWMTHKTMSVDALIDYLVMFGWSAIAGIAASGASPSRFNAMDHPLVRPEDED